MVGDKSPEIDTFSCDFHKPAWNFVRPNLVQLYKEDIKKQSLVEHINKGLIIFIPKPSDLELITS